MIRWLQYKNIAHIFQKERKGMNMSKTLGKNYLTERGVCAISLISMVMPARTQNFNMYNTI